MHMSAQRLDEVVYELRQVVPPPLLAKSGACRKIVLESHAPCVRTTCAAWACADGVADAQVIPSPVGRGPGRRFM